MYRIYYDIIRPKSSLDDRYGDQTRKIPDDACETQTMAKQLSRVTMKMMNGSDGEIRRKCERPSASEEPAIFVPEKVGTMGGGPKP